MGASDFRNVQAVVHRSVRVIFILFSKLICKARFVAFLSENKCCFLFSFFSSLSLIVSNSKAAVGLFLRKLLISHIRLSLNLDDVGG